VLHYETFDAFSTRCASIELKRKVKRMNLTLVLLGRNSSFDSLGGDNELGLVPYLGNAYLEILHRNEF